MGVYVVGLTATIYFLIWFNDNLVYLEVREQFPYFRLGATTRSRKSEISGHFPLAVLRSRTLVASVVDNVSRSHLQMAFTKPSLGAKWMNKISLSSL